MRIALYHNLTSGGSKREAYDFARQFSSHGHHVDLYCPQTADENFLPLKDIVREIHMYPLPLAPDFIRRMPGIRQYANFAVLMRNLAVIKNMSREIAAAIDAGNYEFCLVHHDTIVQSPYLLRYLKTRSVYYCAEPMREFYEPGVFRGYMTANGLQRKWYWPVRQLRRFCIMREDRINVTFAKLLLTNSFFSAESIYKAYGLRAEVCYLGVDAGKFRPMRLQRENFVLSVGAVAPFKGYDFLILSLGLIPAQKRPSLLIAGNAASEAEVSYLRDLAAVNGVRLEIRVNVPEAELVHLYNSARLFVYSPVMEPFGLAPVEAMACGTPVIAVREGGVRESIEHGTNGILVPRNPRLFAEAVSRLLDNPELQSTLGAGGRETVLANWTAEHAYMRLLGLLEHGQADVPRPISANEGII